MASIRKRGNSWQARVVRQGFPPEVKTFSTKQDAEAWSREVETSITSGTYQDRSTAQHTILCDVLARYVAEVSCHKKGAKEEAIRLAAVARSKLGKYALANITPAVMSQWRDDRLKTVTEGTVIRDLAVLSSVFNHCRREWGFAFSNPVESIRKPKQPQGRERTLTAEEEKALLAASAPVGKRSPWLQPVIILALETAMRKGELLALQWEHINLDRRTALLPDTKNGTRRVVPLSTKAVETLRALPRNDGVVFPISRCALHLRWKAACERAGIEGLHFHDLRHTAITRLSVKLTNTIELSAVTGHRSLQMLKRYYHPSAESLALKLG